jgi:DNA repair protein RadC
MSENLPYIPISEWAEDDQPREKLMLKGRSALSDAELIAILIGSGSAKESAVDLSKRILAETGNNLNSLAKLSINDLKKFKGIGEAKAISIIAAMELGRRRKGIEAEKKHRIKVSNDAYTYINSELSDLQHEEFWILLLNRANDVLQKLNVSKGGTHGTVVDIKIIMKHAIEMNACCGLILCHNHPSGNLTPSEADKKITSKIKEIAGFMDIQLLDHIIVGDNAYMSFADTGIL